ncbi:helix-turn-helix domain-containing protein [Streptomyces scopuliridis]|uniref:helix-turn-helix domain-containing protein n=1 Tax=Streptomyces scopuliridis TaxID=452529 RepID=UPI00343FAC18
MVQGNFFTPQAIKAQNDGPRRDVAPLLALIDTADPAFHQIAEELQGMAAAGVELDEVAIGIALKLGKRKHAEEAAKRHATPVKRSIVYYIRRGELIKIGTTVNPVARFKALMPDEILAFEPGGVEEEARRHRQFNWCRVAKRGEYFRQAERLMKHIATLRELHGEPDVGWPSIVNLGTGYVRTKVKVQLPEPQNDDVATATDGARLLGMNKSTVQGWVHRGLIVAARRDDKGRPLYFLDHMRFLIKRNREWQNRSPKKGAA